MMWSRDGLFPVDDASNLVRLRSIDLVKTKNMIAWAHNITLPLEVSNVRNFGERL